VRVGQTGSNQFMIHEYKDFVGDNTQCTLICNLQTTLVPTESTVYLQIYNRNTTSWDNVDSNNSASADTDFTLTGVVADLTNYKDDQSIISCRVYQEAK